MGLFRKPARISAQVYLNGNPVRIAPSQMSVVDGDTLQLDITVDLPVVQREGTKAGVTIVRTTTEVIDPGETP
jgi:hypothetical protein